MLLIIMVTIERYTLSYQLKCSNKSFHVDVWVSAVVGEGSNSAANEKVGFIVLHKASLLAPGFCNEDSLLKMCGTFLEYGCSAILAIASSDF